MITTTPVRLINPLDILAMKQRASDAVEGLARRQGGGQDVVVRPLTPTDLLVGPAPNPATNKGALTAATTQDVYVNNVFPLARLAMGQSAVILGYVAQVAAPKILEIQFTVGAIKVAQIRLGELYSYPERAGFFTEPIIWLQNQTIGVNLLASATQASGVETFELIGYIAEKANDTLSFQQTVV